MSRVPASLEQIYSRVIIELPIWPTAERSIERETRRFKIVDVRLPKEGELYLSSIGVVRRCPANFRSMGMKRIVVKEAPPFAERTAEFTGANNE